MSGVKVLLTIAALLLGASNSICWAQSSKGVVVGTIADRAGAEIKGVRIKIINTATNVSRSTVSLSEGSYRFEAVDPGIYRIEATITSSWVVARDPVVVAAGQTTEVSFKLELGTMRDLMNVSDDTTVILQTQDGARTSTITGKETTDLPVATRNPVELIYTLPGVVDPGVLGRSNVQGISFSTNGQRPRANSQLIDGTENNDFSLTGQSYLPTLRDAFQEVSVLGGDNSAEYGRGGGAVINLITRSGGNRFHGSAYDLISPSALYALSSGQKINQGLTKPPVSIQNQYGFSLGGPIKRDRLFFFGTFQATPFRTTSPSSAFVPTQDGITALRSLFPVGASPNLDLYLNTVGNLRGATNVQMVPLGPDPATGALRPSIPFGVATSTSFAQPADDYQFLSRVDWTPTDKDAVSFRYIFDDSKARNQLTAGFPGYGVDFLSRSQNFHVSYTRSLTARLTNEARFAYGRFVLNVTPNNPAVALSGPFISFVDVGPGALISPIGLDPSLPQGRTLNNYQYQDTISYTRGDHTVRGGIDLVQQGAKSLVPFNSRGTLTFSLDGVYGGFANLVDGFSGLATPTFSNIVFGNPLYYPDRFQQAYFIEDSWRARSNLTLKLGLRYENYGRPQNQLPFPAFAGFSLPFNTRAEQRADNNNFAPRFSFAYTPRFGGRLFGQDKTVIRGGYQLAYDVYFDNILTTSGAFSPNVLGTTTSGFDNNGIPLGPRGAPNAGVGSLATMGTLNPIAPVATIDPNLVNPLVHTWNLGVQRELPGNTIVDVAYVGSRGSRLFINQDYNYSTDGIMRLDPTRGEIIVTTNAGDSIYHSLQARVDRNFSKGKLFRFAYTYSKAIDNVGSDYLTTTGGTSRASDPLNLRTDRSVASFDIPHRFVASFVWDLPGPKGGLLGQAFGGWSMSGIYNLQSGAVETPYIGGLDINGDFNAFNDRPSINNPNAPPTSVALSNVVCGALGAPPSPTGYCDAATGAPIALANAYYLVDPTVRTNLAGRNTLRADWTNRFDAALGKAFGLPYEGHRLEFRVEFFNLFNHPNYTWARLGSSDLGSGNVLTPGFNNVRLNDGGIPIPSNTFQAGRTGRFQVRYSF